jgi:hypothetical protein
VGVRASLRSWPSVVVLTVVVWYTAATMMSAEASVRSQTSVPSAQAGPTLGELTQSPTPPTAPVGPAGIDPVPVIVGAPQIADPAVLVVGQVTYVFGTNVGATNVPVAASADLVNWTSLVDAVPAATYPTWAQIRDRTWAPDVAMMADGTFVLYASVPRRVDGRQCIAVLWSQTPAGPYADLLGQPIFCGWEGSGGAIDPSVLRLADGRVFLYAKVVAYKPQLWVHELRVDGHSIIPGSSKALLTATRRWEQGGVENPHMIVDAAGWWLMYSGGWWTDGRYATGLARCDGPTGPCRKLSLKGPWMGTRPDRIGPGGADTFEFNGSRLMAFHVWDGPTRRLALAELPIAPMGPVAPS